MYIVIAGGGQVGRALAQRLVDGHHDVVCIDQDRAICEWLASRLGVLALNGRATDLEILEQAGMRKADVAVGTLREDADNLAFGLLAKSFDVPEVIARMRDPRYETAYKRAGVDATVRIIDVFVNQILLQIEQPHLQRVATFGPGNAAIVVDTVPEGARVSGMSVSQIAAEDGFPAECVITGIYRPDTGEFVIPRGSAEIRSGDKVFLVAAHKNLRKASKFLHRTGGGG